MSHHENHHQTKKQKKLLQMFRNRKVAEINLQAETLARGRDLEKEREEKMRAAGVASSRAAQKPKDGKPGNVVWSAQLQEIRDKNTGRKRMAQDRWNRFAGTEGGGGRGL